MGCTYAPLMKCNQTLSQTPCSKGVIFKHFVVFLYTLFFNKAMVNTHHCPVTPMGLHQSKRLQKLKSSPWLVTTRGHFGNMYSSGLSFVKLYNGHFGNKQTHSKLLRNTLVTSRHIQIF